MKSSNLKNIALLVLLLLNVMLVTLLWQGPKAGRGGGKRNPPPPTDKFLNKALDLNEEQRATLHRLREEHFELTKALNVEARVYKGEMFEVLTSAAPDTTLAHEKALQAALVQEKIDKALIAHYMDILEICNPEQQEELRKVFRKAIRRPPPR